MHMTDIALRALPFSDVQRDYVDDVLSGLSVRVGKRTKTFMLVVGGRNGRKRFTLGRYPDISLQDARAKAKVLIGEHAKPKDGIEAAPRILFGEALDLFLDIHCGQNNRHSTAKETERLLRRHFRAKLEKRLVSEIGTPELMKIIDNLKPTPSEANHAFTAARTFFRWAAGRQYTTRDPLWAQKKPFRAKPRDRVLSDVELKRVLQYAAESGQYGLLITLLVLTGQRLAQIANLQREWIDQDHKTIAWDAGWMKSGKPHTIPYWDFTASVLEKLPSAGLLFRTERDEPFNNWSNGHRLFLVGAKVKHFTRHDCRRVFSTVRPGSIFAWLRSLCLATRFEG